MTDRLPPLPSYGGRARQADKGVRMVADAVADKLGWIFREQSHADLGIDAHVEIIKDGRGTGRLIALQIKSGPSWFRQKTDTGWVYHGGLSETLHAKLSRISI
jgi:Domain of unknown function (DUF4365)